MNSFACRSGKLFTVTFWTDSHRGDHELIGAIYDLPIVGIPINQAESVVNTALMIFINLGAVLTLFWLNRGPY